MQTIWDQIENWYAAHAPQIKIRLLPGASAHEIARTERLLGVEFPADVRESYRIHNGQDSLATPLMGEWELFSLKHMRSDWQGMKAMFDEGTFAGWEAVPVGPARAEWWHPGWAAVGYNGAGDLRCLDFDPAPGGRVGQIVTFWHQNEQRVVLAGSFREWLQGFAADLEAGRYRIEGKRLVWAGAQ